MQPYEFVKFHSCTYLLSLLAMLPSYPHSHPSRWNWHFYQHRTFGRRHGNFCLESTNITLVTFFPTTCSFCSFLNQLLFPHSFKRNGSRSVSTQEEEEKTQTPRSFYMCVTQKLSISSKEGSWKVWWVTGIPLEHRPALPSAPLTPTLLRPLSLSLLFLPSLLLDSLFAFLSGLALPSHTFLASSVFVAAAQTVSKVGKKDGKK